MKNFGLIIILIALTYSCELQKRKYRKGYTIHSGSFKKQKSNSEIIDTKQFKNSAQIIQDSVTLNGRQVELKTENVEQKVIKTENKKVVIHENRHNSQEGSKINDRKIYNSKILLKNVEKFNIFKKEKSSNSEEKNGIKPNPKWLSWVLLILSLLALGLMAAMLIGSIGSDAFTFVPVMILFIPIFIFGIFLLIEVRYLFKEIFSGEPRKLSGYTEIERKKVKRVHNRIIYLALSILLIYYAFIFLYGFLFNIYWFSFLLLTILFFIIMLSSLIRAVNIQKGKEITVKDKKKFKFWIFFTMILATIGVFVYTLIHREFLFH